MGAELLPCVCRCATTWTYHPTGNRRAHRFGEREVFLHREGRRRREGRGVPEQTSCGVTHHTLWGDTWR